MAKNSSKKGQRTSRNLRTKRNIGQVVAAPLPFQATISLTKRFRFTTGGTGGSLSLSPLDLMGFLCIPAGVPNFSWSLMDRVRVRSVEMFGPMAQNLQPVTVKLEYLGSQATAGLAGSSRLYSDTSMTSAASAHLHQAPDEHSLASMWLASSTSLEVVRLTYPANTVIDVVLDIVLNDGGSAVSIPTTIAPANGTIGTHAPTGSSWVSLGLPAQ